ncbi:MAG: C40 family peptidase [Bacteroidetes bacterium]|nr:C40 family peptidase [Bacteroidota bacterium]MBM3424358.1 NlpC/P60 family protein [Bacteroidota bacterium]
MEKFIRTSRLLQRILFSLLIISQKLNAQVAAFDRMEQLYSQGHYRMVYRRAVRCLNKPEYDYSLFPQYYKSLATLQGIQRDGFRQRKATQIRESLEFLAGLSLTQKGKELQRTHFNELEALTLDLNAWIQWTLDRGDTEVAEYYRRLIQKSLPNQKLPAGIHVSWSASNAAELKTQEAMIAFAQTLEGIHYVWGGFSKEGFDCSGFTSYVFNEFGIKLPRVSAEQYENSTKISADEARIGDLVFFGKDRNISHVGILVNQLGEPKKMIHASSSKGVVFQSIEDSEYFSSRLIGFGRY